MLNFMLYCVDCNLFEIMDLETSFANQILKEFLTFIKEGVSSVYFYAPFINDSCSLMRD